MVRFTIAWPDGGPARRVCTTPLKLAAKRNMPGWRAA
jgi:hypothetical protein